MSKIRHTIDGYDVDWVVGQDTKEVMSISRKREILRRDISRIDEMDIVELNDLDDRVFKALANTLARMEMFNVKTLNSSPDEEDLDWYRRADFSRLSFLRARKLIHRRKVVINKQQKNKTKKERQKEAKKLAAEQMEVAKKRQEEKTKRHEISQLNDLLVAKKVIGLIRERGVLTEPEIIQLYRDAEAILFPGTSKKDASNG